MGESMRDFTGGVSDESMIDDIWKSIEEHKKNIGVRGRLIEVWKAGKQAYNNLETAAPAKSGEAEPQVDWEAPLTDDDMEKMNVDHIRIRIKWELNAHRKKKK